MKGRSATKEDKLHMERVVSLGCIICREYYEYFDTPSEIHHIAGKTRPGAHRLTLPLCPMHHRGIDIELGHEARHINKKRFEQLYDNETNLLQRVSELLDENNDTW